MKKWILTAFAALLAVGAMAQTKNEGINFTEGNLANVLKEAGKAEKLVFVDIYTTWCGPCRMLSSDIFPAKEVGDYMNANFVSAKYDAENGEGIELARKYRVQGYPTMLILDNEGKEVGRLVGSSRTPADFVQRVQNEVKKIEKKKK